MRQPIHGHAVENGHRLIRRAEDSLQGCPKVGRQRAVLISLFPRVRHLVHDIECRQSNPGPGVRMPYHRILEIFSSYHERQDIRRRRERTVRQRI